MILSVSVSNAEIKILMELTKPGLGVLGLGKVMDGLFGDTNAVIHIAMKKKTLPANGINVRVLLNLLQSASPTLVPAP